MTTLKRLDEGILDLLKEEEVMAEEIEQADIFKEKMYACIIDIDRLYSKRSTPPPAAAATTAAVHPDPVPHGTRVKLPKLSIRPFDGNITKWTTF